MWYSIANVCIQNCWKSRKITGRDGRNWLSNPHPSARGMWCPDGLGGVSSCTYSLQPNRSSTQVNIHHTQLGPKETLSFSFGKRFLCTGFLFKKKIKKKNQFKGVTNLDKYAKYLLYEEYVFCELMIAWDSKQMEKINVGRLTKISKCLTMRNLNIYNKYKYIKSCDMLFCLFHLLFIYSQNKCQ